MSDTNISQHHGAEVVDLEASPSESPSLAERRWRSRVAATRYQLGLERFERCLATGVPATLTTQAAAAELYGTTTASVSYELKRRAARTRARLRQHQKSYRRLAQVAADRYQQSLDQEQPLTRGEAAAMLGVSEKVVRIELTRRGETRRVWTSHGVRRVL